MNRIEYILSKKYIYIMRRRSKNKQNFFFFSSILIKSQILNETIIFCVQLGLRFSLLSFKIFFFLYCVKCLTEYIPYGKKYLLFFYYDIINKELFKSILLTKN
jgi:hypothetical protein